MKYQEIRPLIKSGDLIAQGHKGWGSLYDIQIQIVRIFTRSEYSHVAIAWVIGGRVFVIEAVTQGIRIFPLSRLTPFYWIPMNADWTAEAEEFALKNIGEPYSKWECIKAFFEPLTNNGLWQCAKWSDAVLEKLGIDLGDRVTPTDIVRSALSRYGSNLVFIEEQT